MTIATVPDLFSPLNNEQTLVTALLRRAIEEEEHSYGSHLCQSAAQMIVDLSAIDDRPNIEGSPSCKIASYNDAHEVALELGYPSLLEALENTPCAADRADPDEGVNTTEAEAHEWVRRAYREPDSINELDAYRFTRYNMAVAYAAGKRVAREQA